MPTVIEEFVATLGWDVDPKGLDKLQSQVSGLKDTAIRVSRWVAAGAATITGASVAIAEVIGRNARLADSIGVSAEMLDALGEQMVALGWDTEKVTDLVEEMNNKFGELEALGELTSAEEALQMLNLSFKELKELAPEEQFIKILDTAKAMEDHQRAVSAVDMLMGGDANKFLGYLRTQEGTLADVVERYRELNFLNDAGREGAIRLSNAYRSVMVVFKSIGGQFAGTLGEVIEPHIIQLQKLAIANKELIQTKIKDYVEGVVSAFRFLVSIGSKIASLVEAVGGARVAFKLFFGVLLGTKLVPLLVSLSEVLAVTGNLGPALAGAGKKIMLTWGPVAAMFGLLFLVIDDIITTLQGGESLGGNIVEKSGLGKLLHELPMRVFDFDEDQLAQWYDLMSEFDMIFKHGFAEGIATSLGLGWETFLDWVDKAKMALGDLVSFLGDMLRQAFNASPFGIALGMIGKLSSGGGDDTPPPPSPGVRPPPKPRLPVSVPEYAGGAAQSFDEPWMRTPAAAQPPASVQFSAPLVIHASTNASAREIGAEASRQVENTLKRVARNYTNG